MLKGKTPILLDSVEMKSQQIFTNSLKYFNDNENENYHPMENLRIRYRKICAPFVRIWLCQNEGC